MGDEEMKEQEDREYKRIGKRGRPTVKKKGYCDFLCLLISRQIHVDLEDCCGMTPLHVAVGCGQEFTTKILLNHKADPKKISHYGFTPLMMSVLAGSLQCMEELIEAGADVHGNIICAVTPLGLAAQGGLTEIIECLLKAGADANIPNNDGLKPIEIAAVFGKRQDVEILLPSTSSISSVPDSSIYGIITDLKSKVLKQEEKCKEKHKKEKNKEKRESKERKDKDRSRDKHKEKKNHKEKHKEKKRDKDRDKGKSAAADAKKIEERTKGHIEEKLGDGSRKAEEGKNSKFTEEFGRRIKDEGAADRLLQNFAGSIQNETEGFGASIASKKDKGNRNEMAANCVAKEPRRDDALGQPVEMDPDKKIEGEENAKDKYKMLANLISKEQRRNDEMGRAVEKDAENIVEAKEKAKDRHRMVAYLFCKEQRRDDGMGQLVEKDRDKKIKRKEKAKDDADKKVEGKEKVTDREVFVSEGDKLKDRDREKRHKGQDKDRHKEKEKNGARKREKGEHKRKEHGKTRDSGKKDQIENLIIKPSVSQKDNGKCAGTDGTIKKRKDFEINGFYEIDGLPNKLPRPASSLRLHVENGRTLESCHVAMDYSSIKHETTNNIKADRVLGSKERKINGVVGLPPSTVDMRPSVSVLTSQNGKPSVKPPHPDTKFLSQIYSIPKMEEWPEYDNQDWLFSSDPPRPKLKANFKAEETPQMWDKGQRIELADVFVLPYVIPY